MDEATQPWRALSGFLRAEAGTRASLRENFIIPLEQLGFKKRNPLNIFKWQAIIYLEKGYHFNKIRNPLEAQIFLLYHFHYPRTQH